MSKWYESPIVDSGVVISSRIRLARNLKAYPFPIRLAQDAGLAAKAGGEICRAVTGHAMGRDFRVIEFAEAGGQEAALLLERHAISPEFASKPGPKTLLLDADEAACVMINEEDHVRIQTIFAGDNLGEGFLLAGRVDDIIEEGVEYAFDKDYGYLTACPTNAGTGMRASYMLNLPALEVTGQLRGILGAVNKFGMTVRGIYGEGSESLGSIYQVSNQVTIGKTESEIIDSLRNVTAKIIERENDLRDKLLTENPMFEDRIFRSYGILKYARRLSSKEAMSHLSDVRVGLMTGVLKERQPKKTICRIMIDIQPGGVMAAGGMALAEQERDALRAEIIREAL